MRVKTIVDEDFVNYKKAAMFIGSVSCGGKCCLEAGIPVSVCQNDGWRLCAPIFIEDSQICERYIGNDITSAIVIGGLEPFEQFTEVLALIETLRNQYKCEDDVVIYTGYYPLELQNELPKLREYPNIVIKYGRFIPEGNPKYDKVLGVTLASSNQYAERIS